MCYFVKSPGLPPVKPAPAIIIQADRFDTLPCRCPLCLVLDARYPGEGFQLALFPYRPAVSRREVRR